MNNFHKLKKNYIFNFINLNNNLNMNEIFIEII